MVLASLAALERTHRRHDKVVAELLDAARRFAAGRPDDGDLARVHDAVAYFERTVTRHFVDEDGSVFPRLSTRRPELAAALAKLSAEHPTQITLQAEVASAAHELDGQARPSAGKTLLDAATKLAEVHHAHVGREDEIFATAHEALTDEDDREIVAEMEMRRDRKDHDGRARAPIDRAAPAKPPRRATGATTKLTTKRASVAGRSSAKRAASKTAATASAKRAASEQASTARNAAKPAAAASKPTATASKPTATASKPAVSAASKPAVSTASKPAMSAASKPAVSAASKPAMSAASKPAMAAASKPAKFTASKPAASKFASKPAKGAAAKPRDKR
jgi:hemerythrin-like domain-containing protein